MSTTSETQECFVCKAQFTDLDLFWKHIYEVECGAPGPNDINVAPSNAAVVTATTSIVTSAASDEQETDYELPPSNSGQDVVYPTILAQLDASSISKKPIKAQKRKQGSSTTKSLPDHSREPSEVGNNIDLRERQPLFSFPSCSSSLRSLTRLATTFKRNKSTLIYCDVCNVPLSSFAALEQHEKGRKHLKVLSRGAENDSHNSSIGSHNRTKLDTCSVKSDISRSNQAPPKSPESLSNGSSQLPRSTVNNGNGGFWCTDCNILLPASADFQIHREGFKHRSMVAWKQRGASEESPSSNPEDVYGYQKPDSSASLKGNPAPSGMSVSNDDIPNSNITPVSRETIDTKSIIRKLCLTQLLSLISDTDALRCDTDSFDGQIIRETYSKCREELMHALSLDSKVAGTADIDLTRSNNSRTTKLKSTNFDKLLQSITLLSWCHQLQLLD